MAKYTMEEKYEAVRLYTMMGKEGTCYIADKPIRNVRALCLALNISSQSLYRWAEVIEIRDNDLIGDDGEKGFEDYEPYVDEVFDEHEYPPETYRKKPMTFKMGTTFFQTLAQGLGIKNYRMPLKQMYLTIGTELIKMSGLVENGVRKELKYI